MDRLTYTLLVEQEPRCILAYAGVSRETFYHAACLGRHVGHPLAGTLVRLRGPVPLHYVPLDRMCPRCGEHHHGPPDPADPR